VIIGGNNSQINLNLDANDYGFSFNATSRNVTVGNRLQIQWPDSGNNIVVTLKIRCSPVATSFKEVSA